MAGFLLHAGATVKCSHGGQVQPTKTNPRVTVSGQPTVVLDAPWRVSGCSLPPQSGPCLTAQFVSAATRVTSNGLPLLLFDSQAVCAPNGTKPIVASTQTRVTGQ